MVHISAAAATTATAGVSDLCKNKEATNRTSHNYNNCNRTHARTSWGPQRPGPGRGKSQGPVGEKASKSRRSAGFRGMPRL